VFKIDRRVKFKYYFTKEVPPRMSLLLSIPFTSLTIEEFQNNVQTCPTVPYVCFYFFM